jgi:hypothetical protein
VIPISTDLLNGVKCNNVLSCVKTLGEKNTVMKNSDMPTVHVKKKSVKENGTVLISTILLLNTGPLGTPMMIPSSMLEI